MVSPFLFERITIIGLGLIGSSIALAVRQNKLAETVVGCDNSETALAYARSKNMIDVAMHDLKTAVRDSDLVIISTSPSAMESVSEQIAPTLKKGALVMDTASVKLPIMNAISRHLPSHVDFVPAHPVAGSEQSGGKAGKKDLFNNRRVVVTPNEPLQENMLQTVTSFWSKMGARVEGVPPDMHDRLYAYVSHLPHLLAFAAKKLIEDDENNKKLQKFLRISSSDTAMWAEIFHLNRDNLLTALDRYLDALWHINGELSRAPSEEKSATDTQLVHGVLFPRLASSCLVTTTMEAEKKDGFSYARYAGTGFADFISPVISEPEPEIEQISQHYLPMLELLQNYITELKKLRELVEATDTDALAEALK